MKKEKSLRIFYSVAKFNILAIIIIEEQNKTEGNFHR